MLKMSPALFVGWWLLRGRWKPALVAVAAAAVLEVAALAVVSPEVHWAFWTQVLPGFTSGEYNGLRVPIGLFGNHSIPDLLHQAFRGASSHTLSPTARALATVSALGLVGGIAWALRREPADLLQRSAQWCAVAVVMLLVPVYTYEHHLVWALPGAVLAALAVLNRRLHPAWLAALLPAWTALSWQLTELKSWSLGMEQQAPIAAWLVQEAKFAALVTLLVVLVALARRRRL
jgi:alpha-1,2-mannosyltransferase